MTATIRQSQSQRAQCAKLCCCQDTAQRSAARPPRSVAGRRARKPLPPTNTRVSTAAQGSPPFTFTTSKEKPFPAMLGSRSPLPPFPFQRSQLSPHISGWPPMTFGSTRRANWRGRRPSTGGKQPLQEPKTPQQSQVVGCDGYEGKKTK